MVFLKKITDSPHLATTVGIGKVKWSLSETATVLMNFLQLSFALQTIEGRKCEDWPESYFFITTTTTNTTIVVTGNSRYTRQSLNEDYLYVCVCAFFSTKLLSFYICLPGGPDTSG